jgi:hypothetical protein
VEPSVQGRHGQSIASWSHYGQLHGARGDEMKKRHEVLSTTDNNDQTSYDDMFHETVSYYLNLNRKRQKITQQHIAERLQISQSAVCQMLKRPATIGKLWRLCNALGGTLEVNIRFGDKSYSLLNEPIPHNPDAWMIEEK